MLMRKGWEDPNNVGARDLLVEGIDGLKEVIRSRGNETHYPFHILGSQALTWVKRATMTSEEKRTFLGEILAIVQDGADRHRRIAELQGLVESIQQEILETTLTA